MKALRKLRYPRTPEGRKRYVQDSLNPNKGRFVFYLMIVIGLAGMAALLYWMITDEYGKASFTLIVFLSIASMLILLAGIEGLRLWKEGRLE